MAAPRNKQTKKTIKIDWKKVAIVAIVLLLAAVITIICLCNPSWFKKGDTNTNDNGNKQLIAISDKGEKMLAGGTYAMPEAMTIVAEAPAENSQYASDGEFTITATVSNEYINGLFDFSCYFPESSDEWAYDKDANEYIEITPTSASSAKVKLLAPFGAPIEIKAQLLASDSYATCRVDYLNKKPEMYRFYFSEVKGTYSVGYGSPEYFSVTPLDFGVTGKLVTAAWYSHRVAATVLPKVVIIDCSLKLKSDFTETFKSYLKFDITVKDYNIQTTADSYRYKDFGDDGSYKIEGYEFEFETLEYSMFIENFDDYNEQQKNAIYYAWHAAFTNSGNQENLDMYVNHVQQTYLGVVIADFYNIPITSGISFATISGAKYGKDINPDVELNGDVTF